MKIYIGRASPQTLVCTSSFTTQEANKPWMASPGVTMGWVLCGSALSTAEKVSLKIVCFLILCSRELLLQAWLACKKVDSFSALNRGKPHKGNEFLDICNQ